MTSPRHSLVLLSVLISVLRSTLSHAGGVNVLSPAASETALTVARFQQETIPPRSLWQVRTWHDRLTTAFALRREIRADLNEVPVRHWRLTLFELWLGVTQPFTEPLHQYEDRGTQKLRQALASHYGVEPTQIALSGGGSHGLIHPIGSYARRNVTNSNEAPILLTLPTFEGFPRILETYRSVVLTPDHSFLPSIDILEAQLNQAPISMVVFTNPGNPTGAAFDAADLLPLIENHPKTYFLFDEAYGEYVPQYSAIPWIHTHSNVMVMRTFSKSYGMARGRVGYVVASPEAAQWIQKKVGLRPLTAAQERLALFMITHQDLMNRRIDLFKQWTEQLKRDLESIPGPKIYERRANFLLLDLKHWGEESATALTKFLKTRGIRVKDASGFEGLHGPHLRITTSTPVKNKIVVNEIRSFYRTLHAGA